MDSSLYTNLVQSYICYLTPNILTKIRKYGLLSSGNFVLLEKKEDFIVYAEICGDMLTHEDFGKPSQIGFPIGYPNLVTSIATMIAVNHYDLAIEHTFVYKDTLNLLNARIDLINSSTLNRAHSKLTYW